MAQVTLRLLFVVFVFVFTSKTEATATCGSLAQNSPCKCKFLEEGDVGVTKTEILAGAVGALSPLVASGIGFGIWKYIQSRSAQPSIKRVPSELSEESFEDSKQKKRISKGNGRITPEHNANRRGSNSSEYSYARRDKSPLSLMDTDSEYSFIETPTSGTPDTGQEVNWSPSGRPAPMSNSARRGSDPLNSWMF